MVFLSHENSKALHKGTAKRTRTLSEDTVDNASNGSKKVAKLASIIQIIEQEVTKIDENNDSKFQAMVNELERSKKALSDAQKENAKLVANLRSAVRSVAFDRDQAKEQLATVKEIYAKEVASINEAHRLKMAEVEGAHAMEQVKANIALKEAKSQHDTKMHEMKMMLQEEHNKLVVSITRKLEAKHKRDMDQLRNEERSKFEAKTMRYATEFGEIEAKLKQCANNVKAMESEKRRANEAFVKQKADHAKEIAALNAAHNQKIAEAKKDIERIRAEKVTAVGLEATHDKYMEVLRTQLHTSHFNLMENLQTKLRTEHSDAMNDLREQHKRELDEEKKRVTMEIEKWKSEKRQRIDEFKNKVRATVRNNYPF